jgi:hypothetical protein
MVGFFGMVLCCSITFHDRTPTGIKLYDVGLASGLFACAYALSVITWAALRSRRPMINPFTIVCALWAIYFEVLKKLRSRI